MAEPGGTDRTDDTQESTSGIPKEERLAWIRHLEQNGELVDVAEGYDPSSLPLDVIAVRLIGQVDADGLPVIEVVRKG